jgi:hypothetical protein
MSSAVVSQFRIDQDFSLRDSRLRSSKSHSRTLESNDVGVSGILWAQSVPVPVCGAGAQTGWRFQWFSDWSEWNV